MDFFIAPLQRPAIWKSTNFGNALGETKGIPGTYKYTVSVVTP